MGSDSERNKTIILLRVTPGAEPAAKGGGEADRGGVRWMNTSSLLFESSERNKITEVLLRSRGHLVEKAPGVNGFCIK